MEVWLKQLALVLFTVAAAALGGSDQQCVIVGTTQVKVDLGSSLNLCCFLLKETYQRFRVSWYFNRNEPSLNNSQNISEMIAGENISTQGDTHLMLHNVMHNNSGWYFCKVTSEIPYHTITCSNGTRVVIAQSLEKTTYPSLLTSKQVTHQELLPFVWWVWIVLGVSAFILIVLLVIHTLLKKRCITSRAITSARGTSQRPEDSPFLSKPLPPESRREIRRRQTEAKTVRKSRSLFI
ncbi:uncharacterized protein LOC111232023 isoform X2 [Seriola dumerili]|uniref:uncharacterized protein LOC111232023 isoform X2 n=1 Tax=Seriola dumerili TaxID=41447 RepID=UPI000BBEE1FC|nr:uncharacterized protein LOC111232023 isoform X2 [Seriola dumerili]